MMDFFLYNLFLKTDDDDGTREWEFFLSIMPHHECTSTGNGNNNNNKNYNYKLYL